ncbi:hypothetical protein [Cloacibacillus sp. An23]|uniref:hypothetical protein n=1 Tax=Cloacibacillus sp. An23 TaxID=1965591 RepID=UPI000B381E44|nr:hypothetical protein [Cloacibacillus sp. An23]OUO94841.1 hypothetical protein B5F39_02945 [Cloacibacillus sp. An23]
MAKTQTTTKRPRRTDEEIEQTLLEKLQKVQERIAKKHSKVYTDIGYLLCRMASYDVSKLTDEQKTDIEQKNDAGKALVRQIAENIK